MNTQTPATASDAEPVLAGPETPARRESRVDAVLRFIGSYSIAVVVFLLLIVLTLLGTFSQKEHGLYDSQRWYFESWIVPPEARPFGIPIPGVALLLAVMSVNLLAGGILRIRKNWRTIGVVIAHFSMLGLIAAGAVSMWFKKEGHMRIFEGEKSNIVQAFQDWVLEVRRVDGGDDNIYIIREEDLRGASRQSPRTFFRSGWPFELRVTGYERNCRVVPAGEPELPLDARAIDGYALLRLPVETQNEVNVAGVVLEVFDLSNQPVASAVLGSQVRDGEILTSLDRPFTFETGGGTYAVNITRERWQVPFHIQLDDFVATYYTGTRKPKSYESHVTVLRDGRAEKFHIYMNNPLRDSGYVAYQTGFDDRSPPGRERYTVLTIVRNPSDQWPLWCLILATVGLMIHFGSKLIRFIRRSSRPTPEPS